VHGRRGPHHGEQRAGPSVHVSSSEELIAAAARCNEQCDRRALR
jgi:hypothetical protein